MTGTCTRNAEGEYVQRNAPSEPGAYLAPPPFPLLLTDSSLRFPAPSTPRSTPRAAAAPSRVTPASVTLHARSLTLPPAPGPASTTPQIEKLCQVHMSSKINYENCGGKSSMYLDTRAHRRLATFGPRHATCRWRADVLRVAWCGMCACAPMRLARAWRRGGCAQGLGTPAETRWPCGLGCCDSQKRPACKVREGRAFTPPSRVCCTNRFGPSCGLHSLRRVEWAVRGSGSRVPTCQYYVLAFNIFYIGVESKCCEIYKSEWMLA